MIAIVDYGMGNLASVYKAMLYIGQDARVTSRPDDLLRADAVILPGVGAMSAAMGNLKASGLMDGLYEAIHRQKPLLGICLGMQMLFETSEEGSESESFESRKNIFSEPASPLIKDRGIPEERQPGFLVNGLGILRGTVAKLPASPSIKIPHMGWNQLVETKGNLFKEGRSVYFVHSYYAVPLDASMITAKTEHGIRFTASVEKGNICAMQFHPEKSGEVGLDILRAWVRSF